MVTRVASNLQHMHSMRQLFEEVFSEENGLQLFIKTLCIAFIYQMLSTKCHWVLVRNAGDIYLVLRKVIQKFLMG